MEIVLFYSVGIFDVEYIWRENFAEEYFMFNALINDLAYLCFNSLMYGLA